MSLLAVVPFRAACAEEANAETPGYWREVGDLDSDFLHEARTARATIPAALWQSFSQLGWTVHLSESVVDAAPFLRGVRPRGWPAGSTWENADAVHLPQQRMVIVASHRTNRKGERVRAHRVSGVLRHEMGHAIDVALGGGNLRLSDTRSFRDCYFRDIEQLKAEGTLAYYTRNGESGPTETFAELLADYYGGGSDREQAKRIRSTFVNTRRFLKTRLPEKAVAASISTVSKESETGE